MYAIKAVALKTGLTTHTIRVWERRYEIITPERTDTNRRLYSEEDVQKLILLKRATHAGHSIGQLSKLPVEEIERLVREQRVVPRALPMEYSVDDENSPEHYVESALHAAEEFNTEALDNILTQASVNFSQPVLIDQVIVPFLHLIGDKWFEGNIRISQEHAASAVVRTFLGRLLSSIRILEQGPMLISATVSGLHHEFGALLVAISAASQGWRSHYLGANIPAEEIAYSVKKMNVKVLIISIVYPPADEMVRDQLVHLKRLLPNDVVIIVGGRAVESYASTLKDIDARIATDMTDLREQLLLLRSELKK